MGIERLFNQLFSPEKADDRHIANLLTELLEYRAARKDREIKSELLKELVLKYSASERKLVELNELKNKFLGIAAHDLRNPLVSIRGFSEIILSETMGPLREEQKEFMSIIYQLSVDMLALVNDLLDFSVIERGKLKLNLKPGCLRQLIESRLQVLKISAQSKDITFHTELPEALELHFDSHRIAQVIDNLISNALKFSAPGSHVYISIETENSTVKVRIRDEGPGLSEDDLKKVFGEFQKLSAKPTAGEQSTGLGLAICKKIIQAHGGTLDVESQLGSGSTFTFSIPMEAQYGGAEKT